MVERGEKITMNSTQSTKWKKSAPRVFVAALALGVGTVSFTGLRGNAIPQNTPPPVQPSAQVLSIQTAFEQVADKLRPSVVYIRSRQLVNNASIQEQDDNGFPFNFPQPPQNPGRPFQMPQRPSTPRRAEASGSGVIVSEDGYVMTNDHVVAGSDRVTVRLQDGREFVGKVYRDQRSDLALVKINADHLPAAEFADSENVKIGQWAIAFGSPFGLSDTMTVGVVSSTKRHETIGSGNDGRLYPSLIQTDASINPGNSGGPLVDVYGRIMGINVAIESPSGGNVGIGFAIPANQARYIMDQLRSKGVVTRGYLGFVPKSLDYDVAQRYGVKEGALVTEIVAGKPADKAGLQVEDVITRYDNKPIADEATLRELVSRTTPGSTVQLIVHRDGADKTLSATVGAQPADKVEVAPNPVHEHAKGKLGISPGNISDPQTRQEVNIPETIKTGVVIKEVIPGSPAQEARLFKGDILLRLNGKAVTTAEQVSEIAIGLVAGARVPVVVKRMYEDGNVHTILTTINLE